MIDNLNKSYLLSNNKTNNTAYVFLGTLVVGGLISGALITGLDTQYSAPVVLGIAAAIVVIMTLLTFFLSKNTFIRFTNNGFEITKGANTTLYSYNDYAGSNVTRNYTNGIYTGTSRSIKVKDYRGRDDQIECHCIGKDTFAEIVSYISVNEFEQNEAKDVPDDYFDNEMRFAIPQDNLISANKKNTTGTIIAAIVGSVALLGIWIWAIFADTNRNGFRSGVVSTAIVLVIIGVAFAVHFIVKQVRNLDKINTMPATVTLSSGELKIDNTSFFPVYISSISMVPSKYEILSRDLVIMTQDGKIHKYCLGFGKNKNSKKLAYADYAKLSYMIKLWCLLNKVRFLSILG